MRNIASFDLAATHSQILVYDSDFADSNSGARIIFTHQHIEQGFCWYPGYVDFFTIGHAADLQVEIWIDDEINLSSEAIRAIYVPFFVRESNTVILEGVVGGTKKVKIPKGKYGLVYEIGFWDQERFNNDPEYAEESYAEVVKFGLLPRWCRLIFIPRKSTVKPKILRADPGLSPSYPLLMQAERSHL
jgi:hypothetical protein